MPLRDDSWLALTPEPERLLPEARAVLRSGRTSPPHELLAAERARAERLVLRARRSGWEAWLRDSAALAERHVADDAAAAALVLDVVANHDALALGLPGSDTLGKRRSGPAVTATTGAGGKRRSGRP
jgi:hypothetical protein